MGTKDGGWNPIFESLIRLYQKLKELGFTLDNEVIASSAYYNGKVVVIQTEEEENV